MLTPIARNAEPRMWSIELSRAVAPGSGCRSGRRTGVERTVDIRKRVAVILCTPRGRQHVGRGSRTPYAFRHHRRSFNRYDRTLTSINLRNIGEFGFRRCEAQFRGILVAFDVKLSKNFILPGLFFRRVLRGYRWLF